MQRRGIVIGVIVLLVAVAGAVWYLFLRGDAPPPVTLDEAVAGASSTTTGTTAPDTLPATTPDTTASSTGGDPDEAGLDGVWAVEQANSFAGYRVTEEVAGIGTNEAVGRTPQVQGALTVEGATVVDVSVEVDMTTLDSGEPRREGALASSGLETSTFPTAGFQLVEPIELGALPAPGDTVSTTAVGDLTLHGVTNRIDLPIEARLVDPTTMVVVGSSDVALADYEIEPPTGFAVLSIEDTGIIELQLTFTKG